MKNISIVLQSGVSLGTYESGVMSAFLQTLYSSDKIKINAVSGASAGAITGFIFAYSLYKGYSPYVLYNMWVNIVDFRKMLSKNYTEGVSFDDFKKEFKKFINISQKCKYDFNSEECLKNRCISHCKNKICKSVKKQNIKLIIAMNNIDGYVSYIEDHYTKISIPIKMHKDSFLIDFSKFEKYDINKIMDIVFSSAAMPGVFSVFYINKNTNDFEYTLHSFYKLKHYFFNYSDGGSVNSLPLKNIIEHTKEIDEIITIMPQPENLYSLIGKANKYHGSKRINNLMNAMKKSLDASLYQNFYNDLKLLFDINKNIIRIEEFINNIEKNYNELSNNEKNIVKKIFNIKEDFIKEFSNKLIELSDVKNKRKIKLTRISPNDPENELSGEILGKFAGFLNIKLRKWDFNVGYYNAMEYLNRNGINIDPLFKKNSGNLGNIKLRNIRERYLFYILIFKYVVILLYSVRKNPIFIIPYFITKIIYEFLYILIKD